MGAAGAAAAAAGGGCGNRGVGGGGGGGTAGGGSSSSGVGSIRRLLSFVKVIIFFKKIRKTVNIFLAQNRGARESWPGRMGSPGEEEAIRGKTEGKEEEGWTTRKGSYCERIDRFVP